MARKSAIKIQSLLFLSQGPGRAVGGLADRQTTWTPGQAGGGSDLTPTSTQKTWAETAVCAENLHTKMSGIDSKLDKLREQSKGLVSALNEGSKIVFGSSSSSIDPRVSESKSRYLRWDLPMPGAQKAQPSMWSETIPMDREYMDTGIWKPEMTRAQDEALMSSNDSDPAGEDPIPRGKTTNFLCLGY